MQRMMHDPKQRNSVLRGIVDSLRLGVHRSRVTLFHSVLFSLVDYSKPLSALSTFYYSVMQPY